MKLKFAIKDTIFTEKNDKENREELHLERNWYWIEVVSWIFHSPEKKHLYRIWRHCWYHSFTLIIVHVSFVGWKFKKCFIFSRFPLFLLCKGSSFSISSFTEVNKEEKLLKMRGIARFSSIVRSFATATTKASKPAAPVDPLKNVVGEFSWKFQKKSHEKIIFQFFRIDSKLCEDKWS